MIQVTLKEVVDVRDALMNLSQQRLNIKTGYNISKIIRFANKELETLTKVRQEVIDRLAPQGTEMTPETNQAIVFELNEALEVVIDIPVDKVDLSLFANLEMTTRDIMLLEPFCIFETATLE
jgi:hypothetical protein